MADGTDLLPRSGHISTVSGSSPEKRALDQIIRPEMAFPEDGEPYEVGWSSKPDTFPAALHQIAWSELAEVREALRPASKATIRKWLASLAVLVAGGRTTADDAKIKLDAYVAMMEGHMPVCAFTRDSLDRAARKFKFLPSYAELVELLSAVTDPKRGRERRLVHVLNLPPPVERRPPTKAEIAKVAELVAGVRIGQADNPLKFGPRQVVPCETADAMRLVAAQTSGFRLPSEDDPEVKKWMGTEGGRR